MQNNCATCCGQGGGEDQPEKWGDKQVRLLVDSSMGVGERLRERPHDGWYLDGPRRDCNVGATTGCGADAAQELEHTGARGEEDAEGCRRRIHEGGKERHRQVAGLGRGSEPTENDKIDDEAKRAGRAEGTSQFDRVEDATSAG